MELVVLILIILVTVSCLLKVSMYPWKVRLALAVVLGLWAWLITPVITEQPVSQLAAAMTSRATVLNVSVLIVLEAALMICYCFSTADDGLAWKDIRIHRALKAFLYYYPGLLILGVVYVAVVWALMSFPGTDFGLLAWGAALASAAFLALLTWGFRLLLPQAGSRTELLFYTEYATVLMSVVMVGLM